MTAKDSSVENNDTPSTYRLRPDDVTVLVVKKGEFSGNVYSSGFFAVGFDSPRDSVSWMVSAPEEADYAVSMIYSLEDQKNIEVSCNGSALTTPSLTRNWDNRPFRWRQEFPGTLRLKAGTNRISIRLPDEQPVAVLNNSAARKPEDFVNGVTKAFHLFSIELGTPAARKAQRARAADRRESH